MQEQLTQDRPIDTPETLTPNRPCTDIGQVAFAICAGCPFARQCPQAANEPPPPTPTPDTDAFSLATEHSIEGDAALSYLDELLDDTIPTVWAKKQPTPPPLPATPPPHPKPVAKPSPYQKPPSAPKPQPQTKPQHKPAPMSIATPSTLGPPKTMRPVSQPPIEAPSTSTQPPLPARIATWIVNLLVVPPHTTHTNR